MQRVMRLLASALVVFGIAGFASAEEAPMEISGARTVNAEQIVPLINSTPELVIIDSRKPEDFDKGAIEKAIAVTDTDMTSEVLGHVVPSKVTPVLFYCNGVKCGRAAKAVVKAVTWGYTNVYYYALGMAEWQNLGLPLTHQVAQ